MKKALLISFLNDIRALIISSKVEIMENLKEDIHVSEEVACLKDLDKAKERLRNLIELL